MIDDASSENDEQGGLKWEVEALRQVF